MGPPGQVPKRGSFFFFKQKPSRGSVCFPVASLEPLVFLLHHTCHVVIPAHSLFCYLV